MASDGAADDYFGYSVSLSSDGSTALVGAYGDEDFVSTSGKGAAYIFTLSGTSWTQEAKLTASDGSAMASFGISVSLSSDGNTALVGAQKGNSYSGSAYIFTNSGTSWSQEANLTASDGTSSDSFGYSVSIASDGSTALVGAYQDGDNGSESGSAYIFTSSGSSWTQEAKLIASDGAADDNFGSSVSISSDGSTALVGARSDDDNGSESGSAYIFTGSGSSWNLEEKIIASDGAADDNFGISVSLSSDGSTALVGADYDDDNGTDSGSVYSYGITY